MTLTFQRYALCMVVVLLLIILQPQNTLCQGAFARTQSTFFDSLYHYKLQWPSIKGEGITVHYKDIDTTYVKAIITILNHCRTVYRDTMDVDLPAELVVCVGREPGKASKLFQNSYDRIIWEYGSDSILAAPIRGGYHNVYGLCHELGHMILGFTDNDFSEAWADHMSAFIALPYLYKQIGQSAWPDSYNFLQVEGPQRSIEYAKKMHKHMDFAIKILIDLHQKYGIGIFKQIVSHFRQDFQEKGGINLSEFKNMLFKATNDTSMAEVFDQYRLFRRGKLYTPSGSDSLQPKELSSSDTTIWADILIGKSVVFFVPDQVEYNSLSEVKDSGIHDVLTDFFFCSRDAMEYLNKHDVKAKRSHSKFIVINMTNGKRLQYEKDNFKHIVGVLMTDGIQHPKVISGVSTTDELISELKRFYKLK